MSASAARSTGRSGSCNRCVDPRRPVGLKYRREQVPPAEPLPDADGEGNTGAAPRGDDAAAVYLSESRGGADLVAQLDPQLLVVFPETANLLVPALFLGEPAQLHAGRLLDWLNGFGTVCLAGIEGTGRSRSSGRVLAPGPALDAASGLRETDLERDGRITPYLTDRSADELAHPLGAGTTHLGTPAYARDLIRPLADASVTLLAGTDAGTPGTAHGASLHQELTNLVDAGLRPAEALHAATAAPARRFSLTDRGRIAPGLCAEPESGGVASPSPAHGRKKAPAEIIPAGASARKPTRYWLV
jgi:hypothetical protein